MSDHPQTFYDMSTRKYSDNLIYGRSACDRPYKFTCYGNLKVSHAPPSSSTTTIVGLSFVHTSDPSIQWLQGVSGVAGDLDISTAEPRNLDEVQAARTVKKTTRNHSDWKVSVHEQRSTPRACKSKPEHQYESENIGILEDCREADEPRRCLVGIDPGDVDGCAREGIQGRQQQIRRRRQLMRWWVMGYTAAATADRTTKTPGAMVDGRIFGVGTAAAAIYGGRGIEHDVGDDEHEGGERHAGVAGVTLSAREVVDCRNGAPTLPMAMVYVSAEDL
ncbi:hypothetical protein BD410DRAFT_810635 [Rickenella mellea]|uniref:Uncharacterized protein n=1 Tax=Rickenella mellea TaxID=50990 RepID=A0A4Y7PDG7_9AGAM|nr:hypothetical protein BD410DRAFT_810635 [Rickenella mellea]